MSDTSGPTDPSGAPMNAPTNPQPFNPSILQRSVPPAKQQMIVPSEPIASTNPVQHLAGRGSFIAGQGKI